MSKQRISAKEVVEDLRTGADDSTLMTKYNLTEGGLQSLFKKLVAVGAIDQAEIDTRKSEPEADPELVWECPACGKPQTRELEECPDCGVIMSRFRDKRGSPPTPPKPPERSAERGSSRDQPPPSSSWKDNKVLVILLILFLTPVGLYALWTSSRFSSREKTFGIVGLIIWGICVVALLRGDPTEPPFVPSIENGLVGGSSFRDSLYEEPSAQETSKLPFDIKAYCRRIGQAVGGSYQIEETCRLEELLALKRIQKRMPSTPPRVLRY